MKNARIFLSLSILLFCASLCSFAAGDEIKALTVRCLDGVLLFQGKAGNLNEIKHFLKETASVSKTVLELKKQIEDETFTFTPSFEIYYENPQKEKNKKMYSLTLKDAIDKNLIPDIQGRTLQEAKKLLQLFGMDVYFLSSRIGDSDVYTPCDITVESAGKLAGSYTANAPNGYALILVNGADVSVNKRGYNAAVIDPSTCAVISTENFDTRDEQKGGKYSQDLALFIEKIPPGKIVAVAVRDEGSKYLTSSAVAALKTIGSKKSLIGYKNYSHAILGVKGFKEGKAMENMSTQAVALSVTKGLSSQEDIEKALLLSSGSSVFLRGTLPDSIVEIAVP